MDMGRRIGWQLARRLGNGADGLEEMPPVKMAARFGRILWGAELRAWSPASEDASEVGKRGTFQKERNPRKKKEKLPDGRKSLLISQSEWVDEGV